MIYFVSINQNLTTMATGKMNKYHPPGNTGKQNGAGQIEETINGVPQGAPYFVFSTPGDNNNVELPVGTPVAFDKLDGQKAGNVKKAAPAFAIIGFSALTNDGSGAVLMHTLLWDTSGAKSGKIRYWRNDNGALTDLDITPTVNSGSTNINAADIADAKGYTIIIYNGADYSGDSLNQNAQP